MLWVTRRSFFLRLCLLFVVPGQEQQRNLRETSEQHRWNDKETLQLHQPLVLVFDVFQGLVDQVMQQFHLGKSSGSPMHTQMFTSANACTCYMVNYAIYHHWLYTHTFLL